MSPLRVVVVDDEEPARALLREYLSVRDDVEIVAECANGFEAVKAVMDLEPDLLLLDVQMPKLDGFEVLELIERDIAVVFVTAYEEHAIRAFEVHAVDYLLKPFSAERLDEALRRVVSRVGGSSRAVAAAARDGRPLGRILVREGTRVSVIPVDRLDWVRSRDDYLELRSEGVTHRKQQTLAELEATLDPGRFVRVHRCFIVNLDRIAEIEAYSPGSRMARLRDGTRVPLSRSGYARLRELL